MAAKDKFVKTRNKEKAADPVSPSTGSASYDEVKKRTGFILILSKGGIYGLPCLCSC